MSDDTPDDETEPASLTDIFGPPISVYTRAQAIDDGTLVDVSGSPAHRDSRWVYPVALTRTVYEGLVALPHSYTGVQSEDARLWDVLHMATVAGHGNTAARVDVEVWVRDPDADEATPRHLVSHVGPGDDGAPVVTISYPDED